MNDHTQDIEDIFSMFHDGFIDKYRINGSNIDLKIDIQYLAHLINKSHIYLNLKLINVEILVYEPWSNHPLILTDWKEILNLEPEFLNSETDSHGRTIIHCNNDNGHSFQGGRLILKCKGYELSDEENNVFTIKTLKNLSEHYWNNVFGR